MKPVLPIAAALLIAGCSNEPEVSVTNATAEEVQQEVAEAGGTAEFVNPGKWESKVQFESFEMPGAPPEAQSIVQSMNQRAQAYTTCLTPDQAKQPKEDFFSGGSKDCKYDRFTMGGGKIDAVMTCQQQGTQKMTMQGTYSGDSYQMRMSMEGSEGGGAMAGAKMTMRVDAKRVGDCDGTEKG